MSTLYPFIYPLGESDLTPSSVYEVPQSNVMAYSRGNPYMDTFYIPSRFIPGSPTGNTVSFTAPHAGIDGLYPAFQLCSYVHITDYVSHTFSNVNVETVSFMVTATEVTIGYIDVASGELIVLGPLVHTLSSTVTEEPVQTSTSHIANIQRTLKKRYTLAPNNLPSTITSLNVQVAASNTVELYFPPPKTVYSYLDISVFNTSNSDIVIGVIVAGASTSGMFYYTIAANSRLLLKNERILSTETISVANLSTSTINVYLGAVHMGGE